MGGLAVKLEDDGEDEGRWRAGAAGVARRWLQPAVDRAKTELESSGFPVGHIRGDLAGQPALEIRGADLWTAAAPTRRAYGQIFAHLPAVTGAEPAQAGPLRTLGENLGRLLYAGAHPAPAATIPVHLLGETLVLCQQGVL